MGAARKAYTEHNCLQLYLVSEVLLLLVDSCLKNHLQTLVHFNSFTIKHDHKIQCGHSSVAPFWPAYSFTQRYDTIEQELFLENYMIS